MLASRTRPADETFAIHGGGQNPDCDHAVIEACRDSGFEPRTQSSAFHDAWEGAIHSGGCVGLTARTAVQAAHRDVLLELAEPLAFPIDLIWLNASGTLRPALAAAVQTALDVRDGYGWRSERHAVSCGDRSGRGRVRAQLHIIRARNR
jgi:hypothetical protein